MGFQLGEKPLMSQCSLGADSALLYTWNGCHAPVPDSTIGTLKVGNATFAFHISFESPLWRRHRTPISFFEFR